ncbi:alpha/beta fold hydrolase [Micromonospora carbonacea]|jgi:pimeloyl-ACP methyl ester carboxylesterase|uniref:Alpha/beta hydrolase n=1 Tax=Micromonospora carbonacea TaxID=47853 RepID=A0A1C4ZVW2_9ACTN|nr:MULTISPECIES: alpha/beta hydrolase [Micromonospora]MBB5826545.1 pimeloyl-ACP methyl ester carboxylesterase [Micromonospora carbonacea]MDG4819502.1 alpha/beta hydrolase [Micromonospora sp. WMMD956]QLD26048.1 alpha/beta hydrolase [Micromonospora carbonacea]WFE55950.1 alpha/beta hydrolase [Micromonospora sp. WMMD712]SCF37137.1 Pimeloyl-ACP methyl ester carboxylesterase [Micromonospora carbonacea]
MRQSQVTVNGVDIAYRELGEGPLALLVHGFPFTPNSFRHLVPVLVDAGYRVVTPWTRGFAPSSVPPPGSEHIRDMVGDVNALHEVLGGDERAVLIGHDFGAAVAWAAAVQAPERWSRLVACDVPPFQFFGEYLLDPRGINVQAHFWFFQMAAADELVAANDLAFLEFMLHKYSRDGYDVTQDLADIRAALGRPENLHAALGMYRTNFPPATFGTPDWAAEQGALWGALPTQPTLNIFGVQDVAFAMNEEKLARIVEALPKGSAGALVPDSRHVPLTEQPEITNAHILRFLAETA